MEGIYYNFISIYVPPQLHNSTMQDLGELILNLPKGITVMGGDCNAMLDRSKDFSRGAGVKSYTADTKFKTWVQSLGLCDIWRIWNPRTTQYTHTSAAHGTHSRLDYFFMPATDVPLTCGSRILPRGISDHSPVLMSLGRDRTTCRPMWRLNAWFLQDPKFIELLKKDIHQFFQLNNGSVESTATLWAAGKATIRGYAKAHIRRQERDKSAQLNDLELKILQAEKRIGQGENGTWERQLALDRASLVQIQMEEAKAWWRASTQRVYECGDKNGKLLYWLAAGSRASPIIPSVMDEKGEMCVKAPDIAATFARFYKKLYAKRPRSPREVERSIVWDFSLPQLSEAYAKRLDLPIDMEEIAEALREIKPGKTPGPDGFPTEYYCTFRELLEPHLIDTYAEAIENSRFPPDINIATIVVLPKAGHPPEKCTSYRPISLINTDLKIFAKILANRLAPALTSLIHSDQCGFIPARCTRHCIRRLYSAMARAGELIGSKSLLLVDFEKAFDSVDWEYLDELLNRLGFGPFYRRCIRTLYNDSRAQVRVNGCLSEPFPIRRGTRQGCPLSPMLFALAIEPLAYWIRRDPGGGEDRIALYADDIMIYLSDTRSTGPRLLKILEIFEDATGLRINKAKSVLVPISGDRGDEAWAAGIPI